MDEIAVQDLLDSLCIDLGFCLPPDAQKQLRENPPAYPEAFALAVYEAEGLDPQDNDRLYREVRALIDVAFGAPDA